MKLSALIAAIGDENVQFQSLDESAISLDWSRKAGTRITFATQEPIVPGDGTVRLGLVLWLDRDAARAAIAKSDEDAAQTAKIQPQDVEPNTWVPNRDLLEG